MIDRAVGLVYAPGLEPLLEPPGLVDVLEIEPEVFWWECAGVAGPERFAVHRQAWEYVRALPRPKLVHGVGFAVGGTVAPEPDHLPLWRRCVAELGALWSSHHLAFNWFGPPEARRFAGFFLPPRQTDDGVRAAVASIRAIAAELACPFAVETGVNYLAPRPDELDDGDFVARVVRGTGCHLLLDLHNLWCNQRAGRQSIEAYLAALPLDRVIEVHLAGGFSLDGYWLDAHAALPPDELLAIFADVAPLLPEARAVCFEVLAPFVPRLGLDETAGMLEKVRAIWSRPRGRRTVTGRVAPVADAVADGGGSSAAEWECVLGSLVAGATLPGPMGAELAAELSADPAIALLVKLAVQGRAGMIADGLPLTTRLLVLALGPDETTALLTRFCRDEPPRAFASVECESFASWLGAQELAVDNLADAIAFDLAAGKAESLGIPVDVDLAIDPIHLRDALARLELPAGGDQRFCVTVTPNMG